MTIDAAVPTRVLLVEDAESFVDALVVGLQREGFAITVARDAHAFSRFATWSLHTPTDGDGDEAINGEG